MGYVVEMRDVSYRYPKAEKNILINVNLSVEKGSFLVVMGPVGAGKTTLALCLNGLIPQLLEGKLTGDINVSGMDLRRYRVQTMSKHIGLVLQDPETQIFGMTVQEDVAFGPRNLGIPAAEIHNRVERALDLVRLKGYEKRNTSELSGGEKQRLAIAGVLAMQPEILVFDEPASELDPAGRAEIYAAIDNLRSQQSLTIIVIEHDNEDIIQRADQVIVVNHGQITWQGSPTELFRSIPLLHRFGIKPSPVTQIGWDFCQKGWIQPEQIPLDVPGAEQMLRTVLLRQGQPRKDYLATSQSGINSRDKQEPVLLEVKDLSHQYSVHFTALNAVNLTVNQGEFVALIGQNGAGKTTLAKHFNGLLKPSSGDVVVNGMNTKQFDTSRLAQVVGYVFQNPDHQIFSVSVEKELEYGLRNAGIQEQEMRRRVNEVLQFTNLEQYRHAHPFSLGKGQRQIIAIASILALRPKLLVIDEPTTGLDWTGARQMMDLIQKLNKAGTSIVMISHDMEIVARYAKRVIVLKDGAIILDDKTRQAFTNLELLKQAYIVPPQIPRLAHKLMGLGLVDWGTQGIPLDENEFMQTIPWKPEDQTCL